MRNAMNDSITVDKMADMYRLAIAPPTFKKYIYGIKDFIEESKEWDELEDGRQYKINERNGYYESSDGAGGGLPCDWAFYYHKENRKMPSEDIITKHYIDSLCNRLDLAEDDKDWQLVKDTGKLFKSICAEDVRKAVESLKSEDEDMAEDDDADGPRP